MIHRLLQYFIYAAFFKQAFLCFVVTQTERLLNHSGAAIVGPEFVTGSSRMKSGTAQKMVLNMISTSLMIRMGRVKGNRMVKMQLTNAKLVNRGTRMIQEQTQHWQHALRKVPKALLR